jgi:hypothetical protein
MIGNYSARLTADRQLAEVLNLTSSSPTEGQIRCIWQRSGDNLDQQPNPGWSRKGGPLPPFRRQPGAPVRRRGPHTVDDRRLHGKIPTPSPSAPTCRPPPWTTTKTATARPLGAGQLRPRRRRRPGRSGPAEASPHAPPAACPWRLPAAGPIVSRNGNARHSLLMPS